MGGAPAPKSSKESVAQYNKRMTKYREELKFEKKYQQHLKNSRR